jgi:uncharacterized protein YjlB
MPTPELLKFSPHGPIPNNPRLPVLLYRRVLGGEADLAGAFEELFRRNGWPPRWRNGVFDFHHYHSNAHEALGFARGEARLILGGPGGPDVAVRSGDAAILPAGTGHCRLAASADFLVVGAYPTDDDYDICRDAPTPETSRRIAALATPESDPVTGRSGGLVESWTGAR